MLASVHCPDSGSVTIAAIQVQGLLSDITGHHWHLATPLDGLPVGGLYSIPARQQRRHGERNLCFTLPPLGGKQGARGELTRQYSPQGVPSSMGHPIARGSPLVLGL